MDSGQATKQKRWPFSWLTLAALVGLVMSWYLPYAKISFAGDSTSQTVHVILSAAATLFAFFWISHSRLSNILKVLLAIGVFAVLALFLIGSSFLFSMSTPLSVERAIHEIPKEPGVTIWQSTGGGFPSSAPYLAINFNSESSPNEVASFYQKELSDRGWVLQPKDGVSHSTDPDKHFFHQFLRGDLKLSISYGSVGGAPPYGILVEKVVEP